MEKNAALIVAGVIFALVSLLHLTRLITKFELIVAKWPIPLWFNVVGLIVTAFLAFWMFISVL